jgi:hypothetical protein
VQRAAAGFSLRGRAVAVTLVALGLIVPLVPQSLIAQRNFQTWSPIPGAAAKLTSFQLTVGLKLQRYETYVGGELAGPQLNYLDPHTAEIVAALGPDGLVNGYPEYARIVVENPLTMAGVFGRHLVNGLDQRYSTPYVEQLDTGQQRPLRLASLLLVFLALLRLAWPAARRGLGPARWRYPLVLAGTCATSLPSAIETRFMLPLFGVCCMLVAAPGWPRRLGLGAAERGLRRFLVPVAIAAAAVGFVALMFAVAAATSENLQVASN